MFVHLNPTKMVSKLKWNYTNAALEMQIQYNRFVEYGFFVVEISGYTKGFDAIWKRRAEHISDKRMTEFWNSSNHKTRKLLFHNGR